VSQGLVVCRGDYHDGYVSMMYIEVECEWCGGSSVGAGRVGVCRRLGE